MCCDRKFIRFFKHIKKKKNSYPFWLAQDARSHPWCRRQQQCHGWALSGWCPLHRATPALCCKLTSSPLHPALMSAGLPTDATSDTHRNTQSYLFTCLDKDSTTAVIGQFKNSPLHCRWAAAFLCGLMGLSILELTSAAPSTEKHKTCTYS